MDNLGVRLPVDHQRIAVSLAGHHKQEAEGTERKNLLKGLGGSI
jgi:hypothetical protein